MLERVGAGTSQRIRIDGRLPGWVSTKAGDGKPLLLPVKPQAGAAAAAAGSSPPKGGTGAAKAKGGMFGGGKSTMFSAAVSPHTEPIAPTVCNFTLPVRCRRQRLWVAGRRRRRRSTSRSRSGHAARSRWQAPLTIAPTHITSQRQPPISPLPPASLSLLLRCRATRRCTVQHRIGSLSEKHTTRRLSGSAC